MTDIRPLFRLAIYGLIPQLYSWIAQCFRPVQFEDEIVRVDKGWKSKPDLLSEYVPELRVSRATQLAQVLNENDCNSPMLKFAEMKINHTEGGWPKVHRIWTQIVS